MKPEISVHLPTQNDFDPFGGSLDAQRAWRQFGGLTLDQAYERFCDHPLCYQEDFMFMGGEAFRFYFPVLDRYLRSYRVGKGPGDAEDSFAAIIAAGFCIQLMSRTRDCLTNLHESIRSLAEYARSHVELLALDPDEQARIDSHWQILQAQMDS